MVKFEKGDIEKYENFLKCTFVNKKYFDKKFSQIDNLKIFYIWLIIINLVSEGLDKLETVLESYVEDIEENKTDESSNGTKDKENPEIECKTKRNMNLDSSKSNQDVDNTH